MNLIPSPQKTGDSTVVFHPEMSELSCIPIHDLMNRKPPFRKLRGYAFDPSLSLQAQTVDINSMIYKVVWEDLYLSDDEKKKQLENPQYKPQTTGPTGEYIEVVDYDPTTGRYYKPLDLNDPYILAQDGLAPSESNPQFHQQMVYAVAMTTIRHFEQALGRKVLWSTRRTSDLTVYQEFVQRLRIYPHAMREANAYYSPQKKALLFGYFSSTPADPTLQMPGSLVFTCLSHDIIAHETTHAILDGMHRQYNIASNPDVLAFHEAFADIVALFQHFTFPEVLKRQIAETKGNLGNQNLLGKLAQQFGKAIGKYGSLRDAIGDTDDKGNWAPKEPAADDYRTTMEPHARGSILVAAIFEAFISIYKSRAADLLRIASNGTGILPLGELHPDLVNRLAGEAAKSASHVLNMCIRALDYCPPVDITFGDYLRAIITADTDVNEADERGYRLYFVDAFRRRGIYPKNIKTLSPESLRYTLEPFVSPQTKLLFDTISNFLRDYRAAVMYQTDRKKIYDISKEYTGGTNVPSDMSLHKRIFFKFEDSSEYQKLTGLVFSSNWPVVGIRTSTAYGSIDGSNSGPSFQVQNLRLVSRVGPDGNQINQIIFSLIQRSGVIVIDGEFKGHYVPDQDPTPAGGFELWGGCTLIFDLDSTRLKYAIARPLLDTEMLARGIRQIDIARAENQYNYLNDDTVMGLSEYSKYFQIGLNSVLNEPFALLHQH